MASLAGGVSLTKGDPYGAVLSSASESADEHLRRFDDGTSSSYVTWLFTLPDFRRAFALSLKTDAGSLLTSRKRCRAVLQLGAWIVDKYLSNTILSSASSVTAQRGLATRLTGLRRTQVAQPVLPAERSEVRRSVVVTVPSSQSPSCCLHGRCEEPIKHA